MRNGQKELLELLDKSGAELYTLLTRLTLREDAAEELMQELFIKLSNSRGLAKATNRDAYARRTAINLAFDWHRAAKRAALRLDHVGPRAPSDDSPLTKLIRSEEIRETFNAIGRLRKTSREALVMRYIQQQSYDDIAEQMGRTSHQVRAMCSRALSHLRKLIGSNHRKPAEKEIENVENR
ncbi:MAG: sigma-70 family RNA polymerase sigma factor [Planctomycetota bacterium]